MTRHIRTLWGRAGFSPNSQQRDAILHTDGPLFLTAGPGSGKTRVLLWRTVNLIAFHDVPPEDVFLGTFTEKAALQLRHGLAGLLADATHLTGRPYDLSRMPLGTVHSVCRRILADRRFSPGRVRPGAVALADELDQYFFLLDHWDELLRAGGFGADGSLTINEYLRGPADPKQSASRHGAVAKTIALFNRFSEECLDPGRAARRTRDPVLRKLLKMYGAYRGLGLTDLSLLQQVALDHCRDSAASRHVLRHVIVDEYQDTNTVQESLFFHLAGGHRNLCVVGDDDQALYRFRGSTVENLVEFEARCRDHLGVAPRTINLGTNYRSRRAIVDFYSAFIRRIDWGKGQGQTGAYRVEGKRIRADSKDRGPAVVASAPGHPEAVCVEVARLVRALLDAGKVADPNQVAFLYPSLKSSQVGRMIQALEAEGINAYAPRAGQFLDVAEARDVLGVLLVLFGRPDGGAPNPGMEKYREWLDAAHRRGKEVVRADRELVAFVKARREQITAAIADRGRLVAAVGKAALPRAVTDAAVARITGVRGLSERARRYLRRGLPRLVEARRRAGRPPTVGYVVNRITALDWGVLDLFYELMGFDHFRRAFDLAEAGDEGPVCNLALVSKYLARFQARHGAVLSARFLDEGRFARAFCGSFLYALWRRGESEYEDADDPFPKGRVPFLTVHQAKGLEFPVVVLGNPRKQERVQAVERVVRPLLDRGHGEPLDRIAAFDVARMFYVALSRPQNLLVLCHYRGRGQLINEPFDTLLDDAFPRITELDLGAVPAAEAKRENAPPKAYSYTGDYLAYRTCPRRYAVYRRYDFAPARAQTMFFGSLVHRTVEDLHQWLLAQAEAGRPTA